MKGVKGTVGDGDSDVTPLVEDACSMSGVHGRIFLAAWKFGAG